MKCSICLLDFIPKILLLPSTSNNCSLTNEDQSNKSDEVELKNKLKGMFIYIACFFNSCKSKLKKKKNDKIIMIPCKHLFHKHCLNQWIKIHYTCPECRAVFN